MSRAFCLVCGAHEVRSPPQVFTQNISYSVVYVSTLVAILIMGKYAYAKIEFYIISQSNGFVNRFCENIFKSRSAAMLNTSFLLLNMLVCTA